MTSQSWGRINGQESATKTLHWRTDAYALPSFSGPMLAYGMGRSYGDSCLIENGTLIRTRGLDKFRSFDPESGVLSCEAGVSLAELLNFAIPRGWFIPVSPGTKFVTLGGAIANDVHGKNHHVRGTIGRHTLEFELVRSDGEVRLCSREQNSELFAATIGGMGLTGLITWCSIALMPIKSGWIETEIIKTDGLNEFFEVDIASQKDYEYTVSWLDCTAKGKHRGRGLYIRGNHLRDGNPGKDYEDQRGRSIKIPFDAPNSLLNRVSIKAFNQLYYHKQMSRKKVARQSIDSFFYPLDAIHEWNRLYGKQGLLQYQCVIPPDCKEELGKLLDLISASGQGSFLGVLKKFGEAPNAGMMSFPKEGYTVSLDFRNLGARSKKLFDEMDKLVLEVGGRLYPAKDALMSPETFRASYPQWKDFKRYVDPKFQSMFWQRVTTGG